MRPKLCTNRAAEYAGVCFCLSQVNDQRVAGSFPGVEKKEECRNF